MSEGFRVARSPKGELLWWEPGEPIPADCTQPRPATAREAALMRRIWSHRDPPVEWGRRLAIMLREDHG